MRVLYVQGKLTWDYKFIHLALKDDPGIKLTGLTRTSEQSVFRQNIETAGQALDDALLPAAERIESDFRSAEGKPVRRKIGSFFDDLRGMEQRL